MGLFSLFISWFRPQLRNIVVELHIPVVIFVNSRKESLMFANSSESREELRCIISSGKVRDTFVICRR